MTRVQRLAARRMRDAARDTVLAIRTGQTQAAYEAYHEFHLHRTALRLAGSDYQPSCIEASIPLSHASRSRIEKMT